MQSHQRCLPIGLACLASFLLVACSRPGVDTTEVVRPVRVMELQRGEATKTDSFPAQLEPRHQARLSFQVGGKLLERQAEVGDRVKQGQALARIDPKDLALGLQAAQAQFNAAQAELAQAQTDLERARSLKSQNFVSQAEVDRRQLAHDAAASRFAQAKAQLDVQRNQASYAHLRAPGDGVVFAVYAEPGQVLAAGQAVVGWAQSNVVQATLAVPEGRVQSIRPGQKAELELWSLGKSQAAVVREVSPVADPLTRTYAVHLDLPEAGPDARFGMSATVHFKKDATSGSFSLPISALVAAHDGAFVWVFDEDQGVVNKRKVQPHDVSESAFLVNEGLEPGELVVTAGTHVLNEGQRVRRFIEPGSVKP
ncbi:efflux RND transporter periplasmic adaptor subunit [Limnobacter sp.]|uniref:efflux RND transporter periplasmic adaptor subunit n=1 Tax=Limnobacter sp. TaxID=2003368 RepID=UPI003519C4A2